MSTINNTDLFLVTRAGTNYQVTAADVASFAGGGGGTYTGTLPIVVTGSAISINAATTGLFGSVQLADASASQAGTSATLVSTPAFTVPKDAAGMAGAALLPGSAAAFAGTVATGMIRYNNSTPPAYLEYYNGSVWVPLASTSATQTFGLGLNVTGLFVKSSVPEAATPPAVGALPAQAVLGSTYYDTNLGAMFIYYSNGGAPAWVMV
jgi:hypothetical protein